MVHALINTWSQSVAVTVFISHFQFFEFDIAYKYIKKCVHSQSISFDCFIFIHVQRSTSAHECQIKSAQGIVYLWNENGNLHLLPIPL